MVKNACSGKSHIFRTVPYFRNVSSAMSYFQMYQICVDRTPPLQGKGVDFWKKKGESEFSYKKGGLRKVVGCSKKGTV